MNYRSDIQGLRAIAVLPVIFYHADFKLFSGGFLGVDIFFVISGYLITTIIIREIDEDRFSFLSFYERRARRILPALFIVMLFTIPLAWAWMMPSQFSDFAKSIISVTLFVSNILFWQESGYFAPAAEEKPLLHTWSLSIEEQYYIAIPIVLVLLWKTNKSYALPLVYVVAIVSFVLCEWGSKNASSANFYLIPTRAWELLVGSICALHLFKRELVTGSFIPAIGFVAVLGSIFLFNDGMPFPSHLTLIPVLGVAAIIMHNNSQNIVGYILSRPLFVGIGAISYSAYLWHQPLFAFAKIRMIEEPSAYLFWVLILVTMVFSVLTWKYIERPFRIKREGYLLNRLRLFAATFTAMCAFILFGIFGYATNGADFRVAPIGIAWSAVNLDDRLAPNPGLGSDCIKNTPPSEIIANPNCHTSPSPQIVLWGDSYAMHLAQALQESEFSKVHGFVQFTIPQCAPIAGLSANDNVTSYSECIRFNDQVLDFIAGADEIKYVVMSSQYNFIGRTLYDLDGNAFENPNNELALAQLNVTAEKIRSAGAVPVFIMPPPANATNLGKCLAGAFARKFPLSICDFPRQDIAKYRKHAYQLLEKVEGPLSIIDLPQLFCDEEICFAAKEGVFLFSDSGHLTAEGSAFIGRGLDLLLQSALP